MSHGDPNIDPNIFRRRHCCPGPISRRIPIDLWQVAEVAKVVGRGSISESLEEMNHSFYSDDKDIPK